MTTLTVIFWVFFSVYSILTKKIEPSASAEILAPLAPTLNTQALDEISERIYFDENQIVELVSEEPQTPSPTETPPTDTDETTLQNDFQITDGQSES